MIKIFATKSKKYGYDSLTGKIISINLSDDEVRNGISNKEIIRQMSAEKIVENKSFSKIRWMFSFEEYVKQLQNEIPSLVLELTNACNLRCSYCEISGDACESKNASTVMSDETLQKSMDFFILHNTNSKNAHIGFYGGEALLQFSAIKDSVDYLTEKIENKNITFDISTNGLMLNDEVVKWLSTHKNVHVTCTLNGPYHDKYRKTVTGEGSLNYIMSNLLYIKSNYPDVWNNQIRFIANIDYKHEIPDLISFFDEKLNKLPGLITEIQWKKEIQNCEKNKEEYYPLIDFTKSLPLQRYYSHTLSSIKRRKRYENMDVGIIGSCFPCSVKMFVRVDGKISFCEQVDYNYSIGDVDNGFDLEKLQILYEKGEQLFSKKCKNCWAQIMCDICLSALINDKGEILSQIPNDFCKKSKSTLEQKLKMFCQIAEENPELLKEI